MQNNVCSAEVLGAINHFWGHPGGRRGRSCLPKLFHFSLFQAEGEVVLHRIYRKNIPKVHHFSSELQKMVKTSPCFKFVGLPLHLAGLLS